MIRPVIIALAFAACLTSPAAAQARDSIAFDLTVGSNTGSGGKLPYYSESDISGEMTLAFRAHPDRDVARVIAIGVGGRGHFGFGDTCRIQPGVSGCLPHFPSFSHGAVLGGVEWRMPPLSARALAGPALYAGGAAGWGGQLQADAALGLSHVAIVAAMRLNLVERFSGEFLNARALEFGLRFQ